MESFASSSSRGEELSRILQDWSAEKMTGEVLLLEIENILSGLALYPRAEIFALGVAAGSQLEKHPAQAVDFILCTVSAARRETRALAAVAMFFLARYQPAFWADTVKHLCVDDDWEVRDFASRVFDTQEKIEGAAEFHLDFVVNLVQEWSRDADYLIRRAATQALLGYSLAHAEFRARNLEMVKPLLRDEREYVRLSLASTLRALGKADPALVLDFLEETVVTSDFPWSDGIRAVLDHPFADRDPGRKSLLLSRLDEGFGSLAPSEG